MVAKLRVLGFVGLALFGAAIFTIMPQAAFGEEKTGQDYPDQKCQRNNKNGTITTGQCSSVCKDLPVSTTKDVDTGYRTCKEARVQGWGLVAVTGNPVVQLLRYNEDGGLQACALTAKADFLDCHHVTIREGKPRAD